ncbi:MAG: hypothetical protein IAI48_10025 [Candidatus Eremiobacteraeota bacterium]|nr:hypothetical protein [Candidatus Eremiobacteraeota bacterium]
MAAAISCRSAGVAFVALRALRIAAAPRPMAAVSGVTLMSVISVSASPQYAIAHVGSSAAAAVNSSRA